MVKCFVSTVTALLWSSAAWGARLDVQVDERELEQGQTVELAVTVVDGTPLSVPQVKVPAGLEIVYSSPLSSSFSQNGQLTRMIRYRYRLSAVDVGRYTIAPIAVDLGRERLMTDPVEIEVTPRAGPDESPFSAVAGFQTNEAWEGQIVVYQYRLDARARIVGSRWKIPELPGFAPPRDSDQPRRQYTIDDPAGPIVVDETWIPLVATGLGTHAIPAAVVQIDVPRKDSPQRRRDPEVFRVYATESEVLASKTDEIVVRPLPPPPKGYSGLVGEFQFETHVPADAASVGSSLEWTVSIKGNGTLEGFSLPAVAVLDGARVYEGSPTVGARVVDGRYEASGEFPRVVVPTKIGDLEFPALNVIVFSPDRGEYVAYELNSPVIHVASGTEGSASVESFARESQPVGVSDADDGYRPMRKMLPLSLLGVTDALLGSMLAVAAFPGLVVLLFEGARWFRRWREQHAGGSSERVSLRELPPDPEERLAALEKVLRARLAAVPLAGEATQGKNLLEALERARFRGGATNEGLEAQARELISALERA